MDANRSRAVVNDDDLVLTGESTGKAWDNGTVPGYPDDKGEDAAEVADDIADELMVAMELSGLSLDSITKLPGTCLTGFDETSIGHMVWLSAISAVAEVN